MAFFDRRQAGRELAERLLPYRNQRPVVLALPRGGVPVGFEIARALQAPLGLILVRKIGAPGHGEFAIGAVADCGHVDVVLHRDVIGRLDIPKAYVDAEVDRQLREIARRRELYLAGQPPLDLEGRTVIVVDDGIATGATVEAALRSLRHRPKASRLVLAVPVAAADTIEALRPLVDAVVCLRIPWDLGAISMHYLDFAQVDDSEVVNLLRGARELLAEPPAGADLGQNARPGPA